MQHLRQDGQELKPEEHVAIQKTDSKRFLLKDMSWSCKKCGKTHNTKAFYAALLDKNNSAPWFEGFYDFVIAPGTDRCCKKQ